jgi:hypothetical protein
MSSTCTLSAIGPVHGRELCLSARVRGQERQKSGHFE